MQPKFYSGKKKRHTVKTQILTDKGGKVIAIEPGYPGPLTDKALYEQSAVGLAAPAPHRLRSGQHRPHGLGIGLILGDYGMSRLWSIAFMISGHPGYRSFPTQGVTPVLK